MSPKSNQFSDSL